MSIDWNKPITIVEEDDKRTYILSDEETVNIVCGKEILYVTHGGEGGGGGGGAAVWGAITGNLSNQTDLNNALDDIKDIIAMEFDPEWAYTTGNFVIYNDTLYRFTTNHYGSWNPSDAEELTVGEDLAGTARRLWVAKGFTTTGSYEVGDYVLRDRKLYRFINRQVLHEDWTPNNVVEVMICDELAMKINDAPHTGAIYGRKDGDWTKVEVISNAVTKILSKTGDPVDSRSILYEAPTNGIISAFTVELKPAQEGTGDPSPSNIRPFIPIETVRLLYSTESNLITAFEDNFSDTGLISSLSGRRIKLTLADSTIQSSDHYQAYEADLALPAGTGYALYASTVLQSYNNARTVMTLVDADTQTTIAKYDSVQNRYNYVGFSLEADMPHLKLIIDILDITIPSGASIESVIYEVTPQIYRPDRDILDRSGHGGGNYEITMPEGFYGNGELDLVNGILDTHWHHIDSYAGDVEDMQHYHWISDRDVFVAGTVPSIGAEVMYPQMPANTDISTETPVTLPYDIDDLVKYINTPKSNDTIDNVDPTLNYYTIQTDGASVGAMQMKIEETYTIQSLLAKINDPGDGRYYWKRNGKWFALSDTTNSILDLYVDGDDGSDTNDGSVLTPLKTIQKAIGMAVEAPHSHVDIYIKAGTYEESVQVYGDKYIRFCLQGNVTIESEFVPFTVFSDTFVEFYAVVPPVYLTLVGDYYGMDVYNNGKLIVGSGILLDVTCTEVGLNARFGSHVIIAGRLSVSNETAPDYGVKAATDSRVYLAEGVLNAEIGLRAEEGGAIAYKTLSGTMTTEKSTATGGRIYSGADEGRGGGESYETPTYYVSQFGSDSNDGTEEHPFQTIQKAVDECPHLGRGTIYFLGDVSGNISIVDKDIVLRQHYSSEYYSTVGNIIGDLTVSGKSCVEIIPYENSSYVYVTGIITVSDGALVFSRISLQGVKKVDVENADFSILWGSISISNSDTNGYGIYAKGSSQVSLPNVSVTAQTGLRVAQGAVILCNQLSGTMTQRTSIEGSGRIFIGTPDDAPADNTEYIQKNGSWVNPIIVPVYEDHTKSGDFVAMTAAELAEMKNIVAEFEPYQFGSGTPSASNIRPIGNIVSFMFSAGSQSVSMSLIKAQVYDNFCAGIVDFKTETILETWGWIQSYNGETLPGRWISDRDEYAAGTTPTIGASVAWERTTPRDISQYANFSNINPIPSIDSTVFTEVDVRNETTLAIETIVVDTDITYSTVTLTHPDIQDYIDSAGGAASWGGIIGTLSDQTDLASALSAKANTADLGDLATQDTVDYSTDVTNKPTLGDLAALDSIDYTGNKLTNKPTLGTLASKNTVDWDTDIDDIPSTFPPSSHTHDDRYYTETEADGLLAGKSDTSHNHDSSYSQLGHTHDDRYYTETETDALLAAKADTADLGDLAYEDSIDYSDIQNTPTLGDLAEKDSVDWDTDIDDIPSAFPPEAHTHDDRYYTESEIDTKFGKEILYYSSQSVSSATNAQIMRIPSSGSDTKITTDSVVLECTFADPTKITSNVTWTSYAGYITFTGTCSGATTANVTLGTKGN